MLTTKTNGRGARIDGSVFLARSPFRSGNFRVASAIGIGAVVVDGLILVHYRSLLNFNETVLLAILIGLQIIYQWWRVMSYLSLIRNYYSSGITEQTQEDNGLFKALQVAASGLTHTLLYCNGMLLCALVLIAALLHRIATIK